MLIRNIKQAIAMKKYSLLTASLLMILCCRQPDAASLRIRDVDSAQNKTLAASIESIVKPELADGLTLRLWGTDSLVVSPIGIHIDDQGRLYYTTTHRQNNSEFDIRGHRDWEIRSIALQTVEERQAFLHKELSPENSRLNGWLKDVNQDSSHDWRDLTVETENVYRLEDRNKDGIADRLQLVVDDFHSEETDVAGSVLTAGDDMYVAVAPDLWRMKDKNGDGIADEKTSLSHGYGVHVGFSGHGMSGIEMGPDGRIYWQIGDIGFNGKGPDGQTWSYPNSGVIARANPDGSDFEIFAAGLRNTHEFAFDEYGNLMSEDNDGDHAGEKERLVYVVNGSDAGWRSNWQYGKYHDPKNNTYKVWMDEKMYLPRFEGQAAYITPCISNFVSGPAGFVYNPGTALGAEYDKTFFVAEFVGNPSASGIYSFRLNPKGATFELGENKRVLGGVLATGLDFGPDGGLYVADWIDGWGTHKYGRIWKMDAATERVGAGRMKVRQETARLLGASFTGETEATLGTMLGNPDMRVRLKAQFELAKRGEKGFTRFKEIFKAGNPQLARVHAIWGVSQLARTDKKYAAVLLPLLQDADPEIRAQAAKWLGDMRYREAGNALMPLLWDTASRARFFAAEALGRIRYEPAIQPLIECLRQNDDQDAYLRHAGCLALARIGKAAPVAALANSPSKALRIAAVVALRHLSSPAIAPFLRDADEFVATEAARAVNDDLSIKEALPALGDLLNTTPFTNEALVRRAINANSRIGSDAALQTLMRYAQKESAPEKMRAEAIEALSVWANPSVLDRVDGRYRGEIKRDSVSLKATLTPSLLSLLNSRSVPVRMSAVRAVTRLQAREAGPQLLAMVQHDGDADVRVRALSSLVALGDERVAVAVSKALSDKEKKVRVEGLSLLQKAKLPGELMTKLLSQVIAGKTMEEKQAAILTLGKMPARQSEPLLGDLLQKMSKGQLSPDLYLELGEAIDSVHLPAMGTAYQGIVRKAASGNLMAVYAGSLWGGDTAEGKNIFFRNQNTQCMRCHSYDDRGGTAGPRLNGIAGRISRQQILEALISPSARLSPGFGMVTVQRKDGKTLFGTLESETPSALVLKIGSEPKVQIPKSDIVKRTDSPSSMPDMTQLLSKKEIRDVVSFLATQKEAN